MAIFGGILYLPFKSGTIVFVAVLVVFTVFEGLLHILEVECNKHGLKGLIKKMYREFMILGFISFAILLATELSHFKTNIWYDAFHFAHIVILFVGFVFLVQSGLLSALVRYRNRALLAHSEELIIEYVAMYNRGGLMKFLFNFGPISIPIPELREKIEYKIIQEFFVRNYNLPPEFKFANYMCGVLRHYVISLVEVRPISWIILACFVCLNLFRVEVIDPIFSKSVCERYPAKNLHLGSSHRLLMSLFATTDDVEHAQDIAYGKHVCQEYLLRYTFVLLFFIVFYVIGVLVASEIYIQRLIGKVLDQEETIEWLEDEEQRTQQLALLSQHGPDAQDPDGYVDIHHLPDDTTFAVDNPQRRASKEETSSLDAGAGIELTKMRATPKTSHDSTASSAFAVGETSSGKGAPQVGQLGPRRMSAAFRQPSGRVRSGSAADIPEELADHLPPVPVYGAANVRRLSMLHRRNSAKGDDLANLIAAGGGIANMESHDNAHATSPRRLSAGNRGPHYSRPPLTLEIPGQMHPPAHPPATAVNATGGKNESHASNTTHAESKSLDTDKANGATSGPDQPMRRRLASHHRMGSLRDEINQIEAESGVRRLQPHHRQGSLRSEVSENYSTKHNEAKDTKLVSAKNRRFLYLRCLERIMHVEFDFHANEARRVGQQEQASGRNSPGPLGGPNYAAVPHGSEKVFSPRRIARGNSTLQAGGTSMRDLLHSPHAASAPQRERPGGRLPRTYSASSLQEGLNGPATSHNPDLDLLHTDMRSNFRLMKDLRAEMLQEEKNLAMLANPASDASHPITPSNAVLNTGRKFFGGLTTPSNHGTSSPRARSEMPPPPPKIVSTVSMDLELGGLAVQELHELEIAHGLDYDLEDHTLTSTKPRRKRDRTFSLAYASPGPGGIVNQHSSKTFQQRQYEHMSLCEKFFFNLRACGVSMYHRMVSALLGHHIGEEEAEIDADIADLQEDFTHIFLFRSAEFYYFCVEFSLLAQCVYLALWATNFVFIANDSYHPVLWNIALLVPVPINFLFTKQIIFTSVMLKSIVTLDKYVADKICEEAVDERNVKHRVRKVIRTALRTLEIPRDTWQQFTMDQFELYIPDNDVGLNMANLKLFLHSLQIFLTDATVKRIFTVLDFDKDEKLVWEEMMPIVFPELVRKQVKLNRQRRASASFDYQIEGKLVTAEEKKEVQRKTRKQKRASMVTETGFTNGTNLSLSDPEKATGAEHGDKRHSGPRDRKSRRTPTPDTTMPTPTTHAPEEEDLKSDVSDYGDESSDSSFNSHNDVSSDESEGDQEGEDKGVLHIHSEADIDSALLERLSLSHKSRNGQRSAEHIDNLNNSQRMSQSDPLRASDDSEEKQKSVRFSKFFDV